MNKSFRNINIEDVLFFDVEIVKNTENLDINSKEFELFQKKTRNRETDQYLPSDEVIAEYNKKAGLKACFNEIVCISVGQVVNGELYLRSYTSPNKSESEVIKMFYEVVAKCKANRRGKDFYLSGWNIIGYDLPMIRINSLRHPEEIALDLLPEDFNDSGKKPWNLGKCVDLMDFFKGSHFYSSSLDEACWHLKIPSPKEGGIDGSMVSQEYYTNGVETISEYCKRDVMSCVNIFRRFQGKPIYTDFIDRNSGDTKVEEEVAEEVGLIEDLTFGIKTKEKIGKLDKKVKSLKTKREKDIAADIIKGLGIK